MARKKKSETTEGDLKSLIESGNWKLVLLIIVASVIYFLFQPGGYEVVRVVDGDTLVVKIDGEEEKVRLIGVNTPESTTKKEPFGKEASDFTKRALEGRRVYLEFDTQEKDRYGRLLAYVWLKQHSDEPTENNIRQYMFNAILVLEGYAQVMTVPPNVKYSDYFVKFQREAKEQNKGLWNLEYYKERK